MERLTSIPTLLEIADRIEQWCISEAAGDEVAQQLRLTADSLLDGQAKTADDLFTLLAYGRAFHTVAEQRRTLGDHGEALCYHYFGQVLLEKAINALAETALTELRLIGETEH